MWASTYSDIIMHTGDIDRYQKAIHHQAEQSKRVQKRLYGIIAGLVLVLAVSMVGTFTSSLVAVESAKDTVISADGAFVDKNTGVPVSTENPHFTTMAAVQVQGLLSGEVNVALRGQKGAFCFGSLAPGAPQLAHIRWLRPRHSRSALTPGA